MSIYGDTDMARVMYGENARHVPCWLYTQGPGSVISFVGASRTGGPNPLAYSQRATQFIVGEIIVRPHLVIATDALRGMGLGGLATDSHDIGRMLSDGERVIGSEATLGRILAGEHYR